jgi:hypothetical protein
MSIPRTWAPIDPGTVNLWTQDIDHTDPVCFHLYQIKSVFHKDSSFQIQTRETAILVNLK